MVRALRVLALLVLVVTPLCVPRASAEDNRSYKLLAVRFKGLHEFKSDEVLAATGLRVGGMVAAGEFQSAADKLVATGAFASVAYDFTSERAGYTVDFTLEEAQKYLNVDFENFVWASDAELIKYVSEHVPLFHGRTTESGTMIQGILDALNLWLGAHNIKGVAVYRMEAGLNQPVTGFAFYVEGVALPVREVNLENSPNLSDKEKSKLIGQLVNSNYERMSANMIIALGIEPLYQHKGYLHAKVSAPTLKLLSSDPEQAEVALTYNVTEGRQYRLGSLRWVGNTSLTTTDLDKAVALKPGAVADFVELQSEIAAALKLYGTLGMLRAHVEPKPTYDEFTGTVSYELSVSEGPVFKMGTVQFSGLKDADLDELRKHWKLKLGDIYNSEYLQRFLRDNIATIQGRRVKSIQTIAPGNVVHLKVEFD